MVGPESMLGASATVKITSVGRWSVFGEVMEILSQNANPRKNSTSVEKYSCSNLKESCCSEESETCACGLTSSCGQTDEKTVSVPTEDQKPADQRSQNLIGWFLRRRKYNSHTKIENAIVSEFDEKHGTSSQANDWAFVDKALLVGIVMSLLTIIAIFSFWL